MKKQHWFSFAFSHSSGSMTTTASVYIGYRRKYISLPQIKDAKNGADIHKDAVLLSCCYLGKMTKDEMNTGITTRPTLTGKASGFFRKIKDLVRFPGK
jgi:hypothetical protein